MFKAKAFDFMERNLLSLNQEAKATESLIFHNHLSIG
jgi:hypothetical protein